jgi:transcription elongation factor Elf1
MKAFPCKPCGGSHETDVPKSAADWPVDDWGAFMDAQSEHVAAHGRTADAGSHIRKQMAPSKRGDGFYKVKYGSSENGSQTLCGAAATDRDMGWGDARFAKNRQYVTCERCLELRPAQ